MRIDTSNFKTKKELHRFIFENKEKIIEQKKSEVKSGEGVSVSIKNDTTTKNQIDPNTLDQEVILVKAIINTTNIVDSHNDLHVPGIWNKSLKENSRRKHLREHKTTFDNIISSGDDLKAYAMNTSFQNLGVKGILGKTQALVYESTVRRERNPFMFEQYKNGWVEEHSVGMQYVKISTAINDADYKQEFETFNKYYQEIANKEKVDKDGFFFVIHEAKEIEGSAVPFGSNYATPVYSVSNKDDQQSNDTEKTEQQNSTPEYEDYILW